MPKKNEIVQFRYYEISSDNHILALLGSKYTQTYRGKREKTFHFHNYLEIGYCYEGKGLLYLEQEEIIFKGASFSIIPPNYPHTTICPYGETSKWEYLFVDVEKFLAKHVNGTKAYRRELLDLLYVKPLFITADEQPQMYRLIGEVLAESREKKEFYREKASAAMLSLLMELGRQIRYAESKNTITSRVKKELIPAIKYIETHYKKDIRIGDLAKLCSISETHFRRLFKEYMYLTPKEYINYIRIHRACELLKVKDAAIMEIAGNVGFDTVSTFNRNFKKYVGITPYEWRNRPENYERKLKKYKVRPLQGW